MQDIAQWPAGSTYVVQGTVAEDATAGTHISTLTVTPGAGNEMQLLYGDFIAGAGAANLFSANIDDGTNVITRLFGSAGGLSLASGQTVSFPYTGQPAGNSALNVASSIIISGSMRFVMRVSTATISLTHTFAAAFRTRGGKPSSVLADTVGAPVLTLNTDKLF